MGDIIRDLGEVARGYPGAWVEDKRLALTLHYRQVSPLHLDALWEEAGRSLQHHAGRVRVDRVAMAWEVTPALGWDKGSALRTIVAALGRPALTVYAGDGANDAQAILAANDLGGITFGVGDAAPPDVRYRLRDPGELVGLLAGLAKTLSCPVTA